MSYGGVTRAVARLTYATFATVARRQAPKRRGRTHAVVDEPALARQQRLDARRKKGWCDCCCGWLRAQAAAAAARAGVGRGATQSSTATPSHPDGTRVIRSTDRSICWWNDLAKTLKATLSAAKSLSTNGGGANTWASKATSAARVGRPAKAPARGARGRASHRDEPAPWATFRRPRDVVV